MAGHSKWANIRFRKAAQDVKRGKIFSKLIREITVAARHGGADIDANARLREAVNKALKANMKRDTIDGAIKRGSGDGEGAELQELRYEGYGPDGVAILIDCLSDNKNRTVAEIRHAFSRCNGSLGTDGSVAYLFEQQGQLSYAAGMDEEKILEVALEAGAEDVITHSDGAIDVITTVDQFAPVKAALATQDLSAENAEITMSATTTISLDREAAIKLLQLVDALEDLDDVQQVYFNADIPDDVLTEFE